MAQRPMVLVDNRGIFGNIEQIIEDGIAVSARETFDTRGHQAAHIKRLLAGRGMGHENRLLVMADFREISAVHVNALAALVIVTVLPIYVATAAPLVAAVNTLKG